MAQAYSRFSAAVKAVADAASDLLQKIALGTPGSKIQYPPVGDADTQEFSEARDTGQLWDGLIIPLLLEKIGAEFDRAHSVWAVIQAKGIGSPPAILAGSGVTSASKGGVPAVMQINLDPAYAYTTGLWVPAAICYGQLPRIIALEVTDATTCYLRLCDHTGVNIGVDNETFGFTGMGQG